MKTPPHSQFCLENTQKDSDKCLRNGRTSRRTVKSIMHNNRPAISKCFSDHKSGRQHSKPNVGKGGSEPERLSGNGAGQRTRLLVRAKGRRSSRLSLLCFLTTPQPRMELICERVQTAVPPLTGSPKHSYPNSYLCINPVMGTEATVIVDCSSL